MAVTAHAFSKQALSQINWTSDTIKARLTNTAPTQNTNQFLTDIGTAVGTDQTLAGKTATTTTNVTSFVATPVTWSAVTGSFQYVVVYKDTGTGSTSPVIAFVDLGAVSTPAAQDVVITWPSNVILTSTAT
jgi:hypothetical protein